MKAKQGDISRINVYGQEKEAATYRLAKMNLALRGISHNLGSESDSTFTNDLHKGIYFDYIMANPPFNLKSWYTLKTIHDGRKLSPVELTALFLYRYIRIHPFEDGNGRIARLMVNFILTRHDYPMIVVCSRKESEHLEALHQADLEVCPVPNDGAHADIKDIRPFLKYFNDLVATEVYNDVLFVSEKNENVWWYDGERIAFRTPNYTKILNAMRTEPTLTLADMREITGISITAIQKQLDQLIQKKYVERGEKDGSWRVFMVQ